MSGQIDSNTGSGHAEKGTRGPPPPEVRELFVGFLTIGLLGLGGVLPWARRMMVEQRRWLTGPEFTDLLALCQFLPGPNIVNMSVALGNRYRGVRGAVAAISGLLLAPVVIVGAGTCICMNCATLRGWLDAAGNLKPGVAL